MGCLKMFSIWMSCMVLLKMAVSSTREDLLGSVSVHQPPPTDTQVAPSTQTIPVKLSSASTLPSDMPSLAIVTGLTSCQSVVPHRE